MGYYRAGFEVVGVDISPQPHYPFQFVQADALTYPLEGFDAVHASPPCQAFSLASCDWGKPINEDLIAVTRKRLQDSNLPYIIENIPEAPLIDPVTLCGTSFLLPIIRHRSFETSFPVNVPSCGNRPTGKIHKGYPAHPYGRKSWTKAWTKFVGPVVWPWMTTTREMGEAIPPVYTQLIGTQLYGNL